MSRLTNVDISAYEDRLYSRGAGRLLKTARVENWPRSAKPAWRLIQEAMEALG